KLGGVCVNVGCIPSKALLHSAYVANLVQREAKDFGVEIGSYNLNFLTAMKHSRQVSEQNSKGVEFLMKKHKITVIRREGTLQASEDAGASAAIARLFKRRGVAVLGGAKVKSAVEAKGGVTLEVESGGRSQKLEVARVLMAARRALNNAGAGFDTAGVKPVER